MSLPALPRRAAYITLNNPSRRNALSLSELRSLRDQLIKYNTSPTTGRLLLLPPFKPSLLSTLERAHAKLTASPDRHEAGDAAADEPEHGWLVSARAFARHRRGLPSVLVLAAPGPVFCSGHDLRELRALPPDGVRETFRLCADVMALLRRCPAPVVARLSGPAIAAGCQLALAADLPVAHADLAAFRLPGATLGLPCSSPVAAVSRRLGNARALRMLLTGEEVRPEEVGDVVRVVRGSGGGGSGDGEERQDGRLRVLDQEVGRLVERLAAMSPQQNAMGKWAFWTQAGLTGRDYGADGEEVEGSGGDGYLDAVEWAGRVMALHAKSEDAREGMDAFLGKREPVWHAGFD